VAVQPRAGLGEGLLCFGPRVRLPRLKGSRHCRRRAGGRAQPCLTAAPTPARVSAV
jgi:hypothetical protein